MPLLVCVAMLGRAPAADPGAPIEGAGARLVLAPGWREAAAGAANLLTVENAALGCRVTVEVRHINPFPSDLANQRLIEMTGPGAAAVLKEHPIHSCTFRDAVPVMKRYAYLKASWLLYVDSLTDAPLGDYWQVVPLEGVSLIVHAAFTRLPPKDADRDRVLEQLGPLVDSIEPLDAVGENAFTVERPDAPEDVKTHPLALRDLAAWLKTDTGLAFHPYVYRHGWTHRLLDRLPAEFCGAWCPYGQDSNPLEVHLADCAFLPGSKAEDINVPERIHAYYDGDRLVQLWVTYKERGTSRVRHGEHVLRLGKHGEVVENPMLPGNETVMGGRVYTVKPATEAKPIEQHQAGHETKHR